MVLRETLAQYEAANLAFEEQLKATTEELETSTEA